ncbi:deoxynucleoside triphosphate triphosphohydrolase SAMHD1-like isoform X2 [Physella acuta]|uniref:deoxynucleoside triphosphate triphosphohydrolase SAMHD1-like isoform X2 n=1 Tax=Physella acuta TaxID=109671 RepID=UPI0027DBA2D3|nr:deoxynucleoside triphosphate triphosphohydrolase SAMHD1-like isoform X2 [Physella acuta]
MTKLMMEYSVNKQQDTPSSNICNGHSKNEDNTSSPSRKRAYTYVNQDVHEATSQRPTNVSFEDWTTDDVISELKSKNFTEEICSIFERNGVCGKDLRDLTVARLWKFGITDAGICRRIHNLLEDVGVLTKTDSVSKVFHDPIHGHIELHPVCLAVIDTPQFQRLRFIKQLGMCYFVYPGAAHNRFEHSIGVCHLAGQFALILQQNQPFLGITEKDVFCVELAGLCHDLGHGPFSHLFDGKFMPAANPEKKFKHERASIDMFDFLIKENGLMEKDGKLRKYGLDETDILFIKELIYGPLDGKELKGREMCKRFLYEIVSNKRNSIDVDKWDYFARDCHHLGIKNNFDHMRFMKFARAIQVDGDWQICIRDKEIASLYNMFYTRYTLHKIAYQHRVNCAIETMVTAALIKANDYIKFSKKDKSTCKMSECVDDMFAYTELTDNVLFKILYSDDPDSHSSEMCDAKNIIQRIFNRDLYSCVCESKPIGSENLKQNTDEIRSEILKKAHSLGHTSLSVDDLIVQIAYLDFGMQDQNPVEKLLVYSKDRPDEARHLPNSEASRILGPIKFSELLVRVYSCNKSNNEQIHDAARLWCEEMHMKTTDEESLVLQTPGKKEAIESPMHTPVTASKQRASYSGFSTDKKRVPFPKLNDNNE